MAAPSVAPAGHLYYALPPDHIRIIILHPSLDRNAPLRFSLEINSINELRGEYEAISYTWGEPDLVYPLYYEDGSCLSITKNLNFTLRRSRHRLDDRWLWADAICIEQTNLEEKAVQVPIMDRIFRGAKRVLACLGSGGGDDEAGVRILERLSQSPRENVLSEVPILEKNDLGRVEKFFGLPWFRRY